MFWINKFWFSLFWLSYYINDNLFVWSLCVYYSSPKSSSNNSNFSHCSPSKRSGPNHLASVGNCNKRVFLSSRNGQFISFQVGLSPTSTYTKCALGLRYFSTADFIFGQAKNRAKLKINQFMFCGLLKLVQFCNCRCL